MKKLLLLFSLFFLSFQLPGQSPFPPFRDGIYYSHEALISNDPDLSLEGFNIRLKHTYVGRPYRFNQLRIRTGKKRAEKIDISTVWALCYNRTLYIQAGGELVRVVKFGSLCHFTIENINLPLDRLPFFAKMPDGEPSGPIKRRVGRYHHADQYVLDLETGQIFPFEPEAMEEVLKRDQELYAQFEEEPQKEQKLFIYLLDYNRRNPVLDGR